MTYALTPALQESIVSYVRAGGYRHVAAEAAGVSRAVFERWMRKGQARKAPKHLAAFACAVRQAHAQARLKAEVALLDGKPLDWLKSGPGKETPSTPGWTAATRPRFRDDSDETSLFLFPRIETAFRILLDGLDGQPETRTRLAQHLLATGDGKGHRAPDEGPG